jgi:serine/threonine-protein kinase
MKTDGYIKIREIGEGGYGIVWLVEDKKTGQQMAMKLLLPEATLDEDRKALFLRECRYACQLKHPNIVDYYTYDDEGDIYLLMEYCPGGSVDDLIKRYPRIFGSDVARNDERVKISTQIILQALDGLEYAHQAQVKARLADGSAQTFTGIVHRDIEPGNIFLMDTSEYPKAKVADFGLAKAFLAAGSTKYTYSGDWAGKPRFIPRQQIIDFRNVKPDVDVWAVAASYYYMLTGYYPKDIEYAFDPFETSCDEDAIPILIRNPRIPEELAKVIDTALRESPKIGFQTAKEFKEAIIEAI